MEIKLNVKNNKQKQLMEELIGGTCEEIYNVYFKNINQFSLRNQNDKI